MLHLLYREILLAVRTGGGVGLALAFYVVFVLIAALGTGNEPTDLQQAAPGVLWVGNLLACLLSLDRVFQIDWEDGSLDGLIMGPVPVQGIVVAKVLGHWMTTGVPLVILTPLLAIMLNFPFSGFVWLCLSLLIGTASLSAIGAIGAAITMGVRRGGLLLTLLVTPLFVPTLIFGVTSTQAGAQGAFPGTPIWLLTGLLLFSLVISPVFAAWVIRISVR